MKPEFLFKENGIILALQAKNWGEIGLDKEISRISAFLAKTKLFSPRYQVSENPEEWRFLETGLAQDWIIRETIASAQKMMEHSKPGDAFLIFGNTPTFLARILERYFIGRDKAHASYRRIVYCLRVENLVLTRGHTG